MPSGYDIANILIGLAKGNTLQRPEGLSTVYWKTRDGRLINYPNQRLVTWLEEMGYFTAERHGEDETLGRVDYKLTPKAKRFVEAGRAETPMLMNASGCWP